MQIDINVKTYSTQQRILAFFMAFMIFSLTFSQGLENLGIGLIVHATDDTTKVYASKIESGLGSNDSFSELGTDITHTTSHAGYSVVDNPTLTNSASFGYKYTGKLTTATTKLYDYMTDSEIGGGDPSTNNDAFKRFNGEISNNYQIDSPSEDNITFQFTTWAADSVECLLYKTSSSSGADDRVHMEYVGAGAVISNNETRIFRGTIKASDLGSNSYTEFRFKCDNNWGTQVVTNYTIDASCGGTAYICDRVNDWTSQNTHGETNSGSHLTCTTGIANYLPEVESPYTDNITLEFVTQWSNSCLMDCYLYLNTDTGLSPDKTFSMKKVGTRKIDNDTYDVFRGTIKVSDLEGNTYSKLRFRDNISVWGTTIINQSISASEAGKLYSWQRNGWGSTGNDNNKATVTNESTGISDNIYVSDIYDIPLYFGMFAADDQAYDWSRKYSDDRGAYLNNFWWQPNLALRKDYYTSVQGLVDEQLRDEDGNINDDKTKNIYLTQSNGKRLPYFDSEWASQRNVMNVYEKTSDNKDIKFPFYEVLSTDATTLRGYEAGSAHANTDTAKFYQFAVSDYSKYNLYFNVSDNDKDKRYFYETTTPISSYTSGQKGFFPYNATDIGYNTGLNCGFGTRFDMKFYLRADGKMELVDAEGLPKENAGKVNTMFEFVGDDDLWVFIDGNLVLDMGGSHMTSSGLIDFVTKKAYVNDGFDLSDSNDWDNVVNYRDAGTWNGGTYKYNSSYKKEKDISNLIGGTMADGTYNTKYEHTMTIFYMERGMLDSNLMIRFNFPVQPSYGRMKIREQTDLSTVNAGLQDITLQAAENDVFKYTVSNTGTNKDNVIKGASRYPTKTDHSRTIPDVSVASGGTDIVTKLTSSQTSGTPAATKFQPADTTHKYAVAEVTYNWVDEYAGMKSALQVGGKTDSSGVLYLMQGTKNDLVTATHPVADSGVKKSSAEFEGQFDRYSLMEVIQDDKLFTPTRQANAAASFSQGSRKVSDYYNTTKAIYTTADANSATGVTTLHTVQANTNEFAFRQNIQNDIAERYGINGATTKDADEEATISMTEYFTNTVKTGVITVTKNMAANVGSSGDTSEVTIKLRLTDIFGTSIAADNPANYTGIVAKRVSSDPTRNGQTVPITAGTMTVSGSSAACGCFTIKPGETVTIEGIPVNTRYTIAEEDPNYTPSYTHGSESVAVGQLNGNKSQTLGDSPTDTDDNAVVVNTRLTDRLTLTKTVVNTTDLENFEFEVTLTAPEGVVLSNYGISSGSGENIVNYTVTSGQPFTVTVPKASSVVLNNIPYGTTYSVVEKASSQTGTTGVTYLYQKTVNSTATDITDDTGDRAIDGNARTVTVTNTYPDVTELNVTKKSGDTPLSGAVFELHYKETIPPPTYSFNDPQLTPYKINGMKVSGTPDTVGVPEPAVSLEASKKVTFTTKYTNPTVPASSSKDWILPRNDSDYIYFRDFNTGETGWEDCASFNMNSVYDDTTYYTAQNNGDKRSWRDTQFVYHVGHSQSLELGYDESKWMAAEFSGPNKQTVRYAVWERFVDRFTYNTDTTVDTVVWKIQPPDGYTSVKFMLMQGDTPIRETQSIQFELGKIYHKTAWGKWTTRNGMNTYYDVPVTTEGERTYWAPYSGSIEDQRMANNTGSPYGSDGYTRTLDQARKYEPTEQKIIFHCNSPEVWHNIHIEFFTDSAGEHPVNGQAFPGYMMEPYAYAGSDYRINNYLTYELTIPKDAKYFRINNGVASGSTYAYRTEIMALYDGTTAEKGAGKKNYGNYWRLYTSADAPSGETFTYNNTNAKLIQWTNPPEENGTTGIPDHTYTTATVSTDYDYIYFEAPSSWNGHVYAYFYGGGDLRGDNWQRACYSSWPGVAPVGSEYKEYGTNGSVTNTYYSDTYSYSIAATNANNEYNATGTALVSNPDTTTNATTIYKFRIPKGDLTNYSKVVFNDGLSSQNGGNTQTHETGVIDYKSGYLYHADGSSYVHYDTNPTDVYTGRQNSSYTGSDKTEYLYVKNTAGWSDLHINFYDEHGNPVRQGGSGYIMDYAGKISTTKYFRVPIPTEAKKFSLNNGIGTASTSKQDIERLDGTYTNDEPPVPTETNGKPTSTQTADDKFVYELNGAVGSGTVSRDGYVTNKSETNISVGTAQTESTDGYTVRQSVTDVDDTLNICDDFGWNVPIGGISVRFYDASGALIGNGAYNMIKTVADNNGKVWYTKKIPSDAASFAISYVKTENSTTTIVNTAKYPIYAYNANPTSGNATTTGNMFYKTTGTNTLEMTNAVQTVTEANDENYGKRGDDLWLCYSDNTTWAGMTVTFYDNGGSTIVSGITAKYIGEKDSLHWYKVSIPTGAAHFDVTKSGTTTQKEKIYDLKSGYSRYEKDYTLGDMQYMLPSAPSDKPDLLYPKFTKDLEYTTTLGGETISSGSNAALIDPTAVAGYTTPATLPATGTTNNNAVLYYTDSDTISYTWQEQVGGAPDTGKIYYDNSSTQWANPTIHLWIYGQDNSGTQWPGVAMSRVENTDIWYYDLSNSSSYSNCDRCIVSNNGNSQSSDLTIPDLSTQSQRCYYDAGTTGSDTSYVFFQQPGGCWNNTYARFNGETGNGNQAISSSSVQANGQTYGNVVKVGIKNGKTSVIFHNCGQNSSYYHKTNDITFKAGYLYKIDDWVENQGSQTQSIDSAKEWTATEVGLATTTVGAGWQWTGYGQNSQAADFSASYQPEDRYSMISEINGSYPVVTNGTGDTSDFITIETSVSNPYITFYTDDVGTAGAIQSTYTISENTYYTGLRLKTLDMDGTEGSPYVIRLPKNARSFKIASTHTGGNGDPVPLYANNLTTQVMVDGALRTVTIPYEYHHAGSSFYLNASGVVDTTKNDDGYTNGIKVRSGFTVDKQTAMTDPLNPRTDGDFIYFTDTNDTFNGTVYAYYYGGSDGEYKAWPGLKATTATGDDAPTTYVDNSGKTVYKFRFPKSDEGTYPKVIFTKDADGTVTTEAAVLQSGYNYTPGSASDNGYGAFSTTVYAVSSAPKTTDTTVNYSTGSSNNYIYFVNNGTYAFSLTNADDSDISDGRYKLDDVHIQFFAANGAQIGTTSGYIPDKVGTYSNNDPNISDDVYRIQVPADAKFFAVTNGAGKGDASSSHNHYRVSETKAITPNALYSFVQSATNDADYVQGNSVPESVAGLSTPHYLLDIVNKRPAGDEIIPEDETVDIHLATVKTGTNGKIQYITWLKMNDAGTEVDTTYLNHTKSDINSAGTGTPTATEVKVKKQGEYYWKEIVAPSGYQLDSSEHTVTLPSGTTNTQVDDTPISTGTLSLSKKLKTAKPATGNGAGTNYGEAQNFTFTITLTAPTGTNWSNMTLTCKDAGNAIVNMTDVTTSGVVHSFKVSVKATGDSGDVVTISGIPYGTSYNITEDSKTGYSWESTYKSTDTNKENNLSDPVTGEVNNDDQAPQYDVTNKRDVGMLTLKDVVHGSDEALSHAGVNQPDTISGYNPENPAQSQDITVTNWYRYCYHVTLTAPEGVDLNDYITAADLNSITGYYAGWVEDGNNYGTAIHGGTYAQPDMRENNAANVQYTERNNSQRSKYDFYIFVPSADDGFKQIKNIPLGTQYTVEEVDPADTHDPSKQRVTWSKSGDVPASPAKFVNAEHKAPVETIHNYYSYSEDVPQHDLTITKTAKEKVGTKDIGDVLAGAEFKLFNADDTSAEIKFTMLTPVSEDDNTKTTNVYTVSSSGTYNVNNTWLATGKDGRLHIKGLPYGDYYLEEQKAPNGFSNKDSNSVVDGVVQNKKVYFSVGENTPVKEISASDEMEPAYIKLYEHINMKKDAWGDPTFIFKIKQTGYYDYSGETPTVKTTDGKEILVALTVNDDGTLTPDNVLGNNYNGWYQESTDEQTTVNLQTVREYQGMYDIDSQGRIRVEPGTYSISRVPVSRYEFVADTWKLESDNTAYTTNKRTEQDKMTGTESAMTGITIPKGETADIHYYDKVAYYDKFSQVDEKINKFYTLDAYKANKTIKGIRVEDYKVDAPSTGNDKDTLNSGTLTTMSLKQSPRFKAYYIYADGSEEKITSATELAKFVISYEYDSTSGDKASFAADFSYNVTNDTISVANYSTYKNGVYTLKATYNSKFSANFDIVFERN